MKRMNEEELQEYIQRIVDKAPPLTSEQRAKISMLLFPGRISNVDAQFLMEQNFLAAQKKALPPPILAPMAPEAVEATLMTYVLYRYFDLDHILLYVGITNSPTSRDREHERSAPWYRFVAERTEEYLDSRTLAKEAESVAIVTESPVFNEKESVVFSNEAVRYCVRHEAYDMLSAKKRH